ncbi:hypothetical protein [Stutzerimonas xanthomarina]|uniref:hypothetical protein n=1 Tax=Stutzerimonas xanthomarina TaxID=271420 RepID=UPI003AA7AE01
MAKHALAPVTASPPTIRTPKALHHELRESVAIACALEKMAQCALDEGEYPAEELDNLHALISRHRHDLEAIKNALAELAMGGGL